MAQERIDTRYTPTERRGGLMYNTCAMEGEKGENNMEHMGNMNNMNMNNMNNMPAGGMGDRNNSGNMQWGEDGGMKTIGFTSPPPINFDTEEMRGSMQNILSKNVGEYVVIEFLIGTAMIMRKQGILYYVGTSYVTLYDNSENNFIVCDIFSIKFVYFYFPGDRPGFNFNVLREEHGSMQTTPLNNMGTMMPPQMNENQRRQQNMRR